MPLADPWWVNLLALVPVAAFFLGRRGFRITLTQVLGLTMWGTAFGFVEGTVVVYLRAIAAAGMGLPPNLASVIQISRTLAPSAASIIPTDLLMVEVYREVATIAMLLGGALVVAGGWRERVAAFLWTFALWDLVYYDALWIFARWPESLGTLDILFLIPREWIAPVWFPVLVSGATCVALAVRWRPIRPSMR